MNKKVMIGFQVSERTGKVECELIENSGVLLRGENVVMSEIKPFWSDVH